MTNIIKIENHMVSVALNDGTVIEASQDEFDFKIYENMIIKVHRNHQGKYFFSIDETVQEFKSENLDKIYVNKSTYGTLALLAGGLGIHEFYAKRNGRGWVSLFISFFMVLAFLIFATNPSITDETLIKTLGMLGLIVLRIIFIRCKAIAILWRQADGNGNIAIPK